MGKKKANKEESAHMSRVADLGCLVCRNLGIPDSPAEIHHVRAGMGMGQRNSHFKVLPLCFHHHSAQGLDGFHRSPTGWQAKYGTELELLEQVKRLLDE